jgi:hypothetical protein
MSIAGADTRRRFPEAVARPSSILVTSAPTGGSLSEGLGLWFVANHFDVVPVRTNDESGVVVRVVLRAQTRRTIVFATRFQRRPIECFDLLTILGHERQVKIRRLLLGWEQA